MKPFFDQKKKGRYRRPGAETGEAQPPGLTKRQNEKCPREAVKKEFSDTSSDRL